MLNGGPQLCLLPSNAVHLFWLLPSLATMQRCEKTVSQSFTLRYELVNKHGLSEALCLLPLKATVRFLLRHSAGLFSDQFINRWCHQRGLSFASGRMGFVAAVGSSIQCIAFDWSPSRWAFAYQCKAFANTNSAVWLWNLLKRIQFFYTWRSTLHLELTTTFKWRNRWLQVERTQSRWIPN